MKKLDFVPLKTGMEFRKNYKLHDLAEEMGKSLLTQWGFDYKDFGGDNRFEKIWERGKDKPDAYIDYNGKIAFIEWKSKRKSRWLVNKRAVEAYERWSNKINVPIIICFFIFNEDKDLEDRRFAIVGKHKYIKSEKKQWDKNVTVEFEKTLPEFTKPNLLKYLY